jgi:hypothetical protein
MMTTESCMSVWKLEIVSQPGHPHMNARVTANVRVEEY